MAGQQGVLQLGQHGVVEAEHPLHQGLARRRCGRRRCGGSPRGPERDSQPDARSSPSVEGRSDGGSGGMESRHGGEPTARPPAASRPRGRGPPRPDLVRRRPPGGRMMSRQSPGEVAPAVRDDGPGRCEWRGWPPRADGREGGRRGREHDTRGPEAGSGRAGRGAGRPRRPHAAAGPLVAQPPATVVFLTDCRRLLDLGRLPERQLLRGRGACTGTSSRPLYSPCSPGAACQAARAGSSTWAGGRSRRRCWPSPFRAGSGSPATTTARPTTGASGSPRRPAAVADGHASYTR